MTGYSRLEAELSNRDVITLIISGLALAISIYGIYERRSATDRALRIRLTELIDELAEIGVDDLRLGYSGKTEAEVQILRNASANRRWMLAVQAVDLLERYRGLVTPAELMNLAGVQHAISDTTTERDLWEKAVAQSKKATMFTQSAAWRGLAWCCFDQGDLDRARLAIQHSLEARPPVDDVVRLERLEVLFSWFDYEWRENPTDLGYLTPVLEQIDAELREVKHADWRFEGSERLRLARERLSAGE
jgi:hypothetical protein